MVVNPTQPNPTQHLTPQIFNECGPPHLGQRPEGIAALVAAPAPSTSTRHKRSPPAPPTSPDQFMLSDERTNPGLRYDNTDGGGGRPGNNRGRVGRRRYRVRGGGAGNKTGQGRRPRPRGGPGGRRRKLMPGAGGARRRPGAAVGGGGRELSLERLSFNAAETRGEGEQITQSLNRAIKEIKTKVGALSLGP